MTCKERYMQEHPDKSISEVIKYFCPCEFYDIDDPEDCNGGVALNNLEECKQCWNREIPGTPSCGSEDVLDKLEHKKEKENMCACNEILAYKDRVAELEKENARLEKALEDRYEGYLNSLNSRDGEIGRLVATNEELANKLAAERARNMKLQDMVATRDEEIEKLVKENERLNEDVINLTKADEINMDTIRMLHGRVEVLKEQIKNLRAEKDAMTAGKAKVIAAMKEDMKTKDKDIDILKVRVENQVSSIKYLCDRNKWLNDQVDAKNKRIQELCSRIDKLDEARYIEQDITMTKDLYELFRQARPIVIPKEEPTIRPLNEIPYVRYANHIRMKYKALTDNGFSHDDAMALIPMWDDNEFKGFKHDGFRAAVTLVDEMHEYKEN